MLSMSGAPCWGRRADLSGNDRKAWPCGLHGKTDGYGPSEGSDERM
jgi:hypothetical protein